MSDVGLAVGGFRLAGISDLDVLVEIQSICDCQYWTSLPTSFGEGVVIKGFYHVGDASFRARCKVAIHKVCCSFFALFPGD